MQGWQRKLTKLQVASFPWDPTPPPPAPAPAAAPAASAPAQQAGTPSYTSAQLSPPVNAQPLSIANGLPGAQNANGHHPQPDSGVKTEPVVKQEPGAPNSGMPPAHAGGMPQYNTGAPTNVAAQRAMSQLQNQFGARAAASIGAIQGYGQAGQPAQPAQPAQGQGQGVMAPRPAGGQPAARPVSQAQYSQQLASQQAAMVQQQAQNRPPQGQFPGQRPGSSHQNGFQQSQVDGAGDEYEGVLMRRDGNGETSELGRVDIDRMLHQQIAAKGKQMEGGGLMLPLKQATKNKSIAKKSGPDGPAGFDGVDDEVKREEEVDEDAINSDLDDPNEVDIEDEDDEDNMDQVMLCMYDKVQRVKNKW